MKGLPVVHDEKSKSGSSTFTLVYFAIVGFKFGTIVFSLIKT